MHPPSESPSSSDVVSARKKQENKDDETTKILKQCGWPEIEMQLKVIFIEKKLSVPRLAV